MFDVQFMTGATLLALVNLIGVLLVLYLLVKGVKKIVKQYPDDLSPPKELFWMMVIGVFLVFFGSLTQPKITIDTPMNRDLIEYQDNDSDVVIETPPPRTETLEGFQPLKKE